MSNDPTPPGPARTRRQRAANFSPVSDGLSAIEAELARRAQRRAISRGQAIEPDGDRAADPVPDVVIPFDRAARSIRPDSDSSDSAGRRRIIRAIEEAIDRLPAHGATEDPKDEPLDLDESDEVGDEDEEEEEEEEEDFDIDIEKRPIADIIAEMIRDLAVAIPPGLPPLERPIPADLAALLARAGAPRPTASVIALRPASPGPKTDSDPQSSP